LAKRAAAALLTVAALVFAACSQANNTSSSPTSASSTTSSQGASTTSTPSAQTQTCQVNQLSLSLFGSSGAAGTLESTFVFRNTSGGSCALYGFPGAQMLSSAGAVLATQTTVRGGTYPFTNFAPSHVTLAPGTTAFFNVGYSDVISGATGCSVASQVEITPPNDTSYVVVPVLPQINACGGGTLHV